MPQVLDFPDFQKQIQPFFNQYCIQCHSPSGTEPDIRLDAFSDAAAMEKGMMTFEKVVTVLRGQRMPPKDETQPSKEDRTRVMEWLAAYTTGVDCSNPTMRNPGRVTLHRLNRVEYNNTIRDLLALDFQPANAFPADDAGYGFDNNGDVLSIAPVLMEKCITAAGLVLDKSIFADPIEPPPAKQWMAASLEGTIPLGDPAATIAGRGPGARPTPVGRIFNYKGEISVDHEFPVDGEYVLHFRAYGRQRPAGQFMIDGQNVGRPVQLTEDQAKVYATGKLKIAAGKHRITLAFTNGGTKEDYDRAQAAAAEAAAKAATQPAAVAAPEVVDEDAALVNAGARGAQQRRPAGDAVAAAPASAPATQGAARGQRGARGGAARGNRAGGAAGGGGGSNAPMLAVVFIEAEGPFEITPQRMPESYRRVMVARPSATVSKPQAAEKIIRNFASKAYRRPVTNEEVQNLMAIWSKGDSAGDTFDASIHTALQAVLVSPHFLYRYEKDAGSEDPSGIRTLDEYELASRLSYFLWSSMPDEELFSLAQNGQLRANLGAQIQRMLKDPKSRALVDNFVGQWLKLRMMDFVTPDAKTFPEFDPALREAMIAETQMLFHSIMQEDRSMIDLIDADFTFLNERLAKHYGIDGVSGNEMRRVQVAATHRGGLLTQGSILTLTSYPGRTSPVQRGKWVLENLLDQAPPPPPPNIPPLQDQGQLKGTLRQRMEQHRSNPACANCHEQMDAIGFGLENFNAIGGWRDSDGDAPIDPTGELPGGMKFNGPAQLKQIIKARQDDFCRTITSKLLTYSLGRGLEKFDACIVDEISAKVKQDGYKFSVLVNEIVRSDPFQKRGSK